MNVDGRTVLVTGAARGIGRSLALACAASGARVAITDVLAQELEGVREELGDGCQLAVPCDLTDGDAVTRMVGAVRDQLGAIDVCCANAGVALGGDPIQTPEEIWELTFDVNVRQHVRLARLLLPDWLKRGEGYFVATASAAGLLTQIGSAPYAVSKHAAVAFAEWLSVHLRRPRAAGQLPMSDGRRHRDARRGADRLAGRGRGRGSSEPRASC